MSRSPGRVVLVPGTLALLPAYAGLQDPVAPLRAACLAAVATLSGRVEVVATRSGVRVAAYLLEGTERTGDDVSWLVVGNGTATRSEKAPGHLDPRATGFDEHLRSLLTQPDPVGLAALDLDLARGLWADADGLTTLGSDLLTTQHRAAVSYDDDPFGVQYWVIAWEVSRED